MLNRQEIKKLIENSNLIEGYFDLDIQLAPNGFDLTVASIFEFDTPGALDFSNKEREVPEGKIINPQKRVPEDKFGWWNLKIGVYKIRTNETVNMPDNLAAIAFPRSSLLRSGAFTQTAVWDAGFKGRSEFILLVQNPKGIMLKQNARIAQLVFTKINKTDKIYEGIYQEQKRSKKRSEDICR
jgi:dUTP pyrophosphatase